MKHAFRFACDVMIPQGCDAERDARLYLHFLNSTVLLLLRFYDTIRWMGLLVNGWIEDTLCVRVCVWGCFQRWTWT